MEIVALHEFYRFHANLFAWLNDRPPLGELACQLNREAPLLRIKLPHPQQVC